VQMGRTAHGRGPGGRPTLARPVFAAPNRNVDLLEWFSDEEREVCSDCGEKACVSFPGLQAAFCLACNAVKVDGKKIELA
jgi:hypothetical protein